MDGNMGVCLHLLQKIEDGENLDVVLAFKPVTKTDISNKISFRFACFLY